MTYTKEQMLKAIKEAHAKGIDDAVKMSNTGNLPAFKPEDYLPKEEEVGNLNKAYLSNGTSVPVKFHEGRWYIEHPKISKEPKPPEILYISSTKISDLPVHVKINDLITAVNYLLRQIK